MGTTAVSTATGQLYDRDFYAWIQQQVGMLRVGNLGSLDMDNLIEEIESMGRSPQNARGRSIRQWMMTSGRMLTAIS